LDRTIYAKGFPGATATIDEISAIFAPYGKVLSVRIRKDLEKKSKDSAFIEFATPDDAKKAAAASPHPKYKDAELTKVMMKQDYVNMKKEERKKVEKDKKDTKRKAEEPAEDKDTKRDAKKPRKGKEGKEEKKEEEEKLTPGVIVHFKNIGENVTREILKETFGKYGKVAFADFSQNQLQGHIRFDLADDAKKAVEGMIKDKTQIGGKVPELKVIDGEEEKTYWEKVKQARDDKKRKAKGGKRGGKRKRY